MTTNYRKLIEDLEFLGLNQIAQQLDQDGILPEQEQMTKIDFLIQLIQAEVQAKKSIELNKQVIQARFPQVKRFEEYDFSCLEDTQAKKISDLKHLGFMEQKENLIFMGSPGIGKTHLAIAVGVEASLQGKRTLFINCHELLVRLNRATEKNTIENVLNRYANYELLIIDEVGYLPIRKNEAYLFFQLINRRYERHPTIITTNLPFSEWGNLFESPETVSVIVDRLVHHSQIFKMKGDSYRMKEALKRNEI